MELRRLVGLGCIAFGALNILNFWSPVPVPTMGLSAFIAGAAFVGLGCWLRLPRDEAGRVRLGRGRTTSRSSSAPDPLLAIRVLRLAEEAKGRLTVSLAAMRLDVPLDQAQDALDECVVKGAARLDIDEASGMAEYRFPEFLPPPDAGA